MKDWAEREIELACKKENHGCDDESFEYSCACYQSALKAYKTLIEDDHSGLSFVFTAKILENLLHEIPLTLITEDDFDLSVSYDGTNGKKITPCTRRKGLFREENADGTVVYRDVDRTYCVNIDDPKDIYHSNSCRFVDEHFPITFPYMPHRKKYKVYERTHNTKPGIFDAVEVLYIETPSGEIKDINKYYIENGDIYMKEVTKEEYDKFIRK